jgi:ribosomal protein S18 acetylase RimI-like enzyme
MSATTAVIAPVTNKSTDNQNTEGLQFEIHEVDEFDSDCVPSRVLSSQSLPKQPQQQPPVEDDAGSDSDCSDLGEGSSPVPLLRSTSGIDDQIRRVDFKDEANNAKILEFLESQGIDTNALVQKHIMKYSSRCRIAVDDSGKIVGFAMFDNEINQELIANAPKEEVEMYMQTRPFIFIQLLIVDPTAHPEKKWSGRLIASVLECIIKNRKVAIVRTKADDEAEIQLYKSAGFYTMEDMRVPSYSALKDNIAILAYTPLGLEQTAAIFQKFYSSGARF